MTPVLCFDLETVPDVAALRRLRPEWAALNDSEVAACARAERQEKSGSEILPLHLQRIVAIGCAFRDDNGLRVRCLGSEQDSEGKLIADFFRLIERYTPQLVSWNGGGFDLPVLHYRALLHGVAAARYWELGEDDRDFRFNNYVNRYHTRHLDLMDLLALYQPRAAAPLDDIARLCGFPGKLGMDGARVWEAYQAGNLAAIRNYCETDVVNTYLVYCRFQRMRGLLDEHAYAEEMAHVRSILAQLDGAHWREFLKAWPAA
ncbi:MAG: 3'-5' exonuclease [Sutterellaceae bacterium]|nr:3'-5' exonuclease [Burkholderiaceae bacterium]MCX7901320.1 3'-5' exonuclease [Burkholderiaceae bacterium]MDW8429055.1 3'-5' exonuclease [Sutterellaceae bacterium]